jgi:hypothetical protein
MNVNERNVDMKGFLGIFPVGKYVDENRDFGFEWKNYDIKLNQS